MVNTLPQYQVTERVGRRTLLGIRFWDPALDTQIHDGLSVTLSPADNTDKTVTAHRTRSGIYAFDGIPGLYDLETGGDGSTVASPAQLHAYVLDVEDLTGQYSGVAQVINLPLSYSGLFLVNSNTGSPAQPAKGFNLYSSITRMPQAQYTCIRGELINTQNNQSASNALVKVQTEDGAVWYGLSDDDGKFSVLMPYPVLHVTYGSSPPVNDGIHLFQRTWNITLSVMYAPSAQQAVPGSDKPGYSSILSQSPALIHPQAPGSPPGGSNQLTLQLNYGRDLVVSTDSFSELYISPA